MKYSYLFILLFALIMVSISCDKKETLQVDQGQAYYPLNIGHYVSYQVDSFLYNDASYPIIRVDTISYQIKELIDTIYKDNENRDAYRIIRYRRPDATASWEIDRIWSIVRNATNIVKNEDDLHFIKLVFPTTEATVWAGNSLIVTDNENEYLKDWPYTYLDVGASLTYNGLSFDTCLSVSQINSENLIEKKYSVEQYAKNVGLIYKELKFLGKQRDLTSSWDFPETGIWVRYVVIDHN